MAEVEAASDETTLPPAKSFPLLVLIPGMALAALCCWLNAREIWELTFLAWRNGPSGPGCDLSCTVNNGGLILESLILLFWFLPCLVTCIVWKLRRRRVKLLTWIALGTTALCLGLRFFDSNTLNWIFIDRVASSPRAGVFLANAGGDDDPRVLQGLLERGVPVDSRNRTGMTALGMAAMAGKPKTVALLIAKGADVDATDLYGDSPLQAAQMWTHQNEERLTEDERKTDEGTHEVIAILLQHGAHSLAGNDEQRKRAEEQIQQNWDAVANAR